QFRRCYVHRNARAPAERQVGSLAILTDVEHPWRHASFQVLQDSRLVLQHLPDPAPTAHSRDLDRCLVVVPASHPIDFAILNYADAFQDFEVSDAVTNLETGHDLLCLLTPGVDQHTGINQLA